MISILNVYEETLETPLDYEIAKGELRMNRLFTALEFCEKFKGFSLEEDAYLEDASSEGLPFDTYMEAKDKVEKAIEESGVKEKNLLASIWKELKSLIEKLIDAIKNKNHNVTVNVTPNTMMRVPGKEVKKHGLIRGLFKAFGKVIGNPITFPFKVAALILAIKAVIARKKIYGEVKETQQKVADFVNMPKKQLDSMRKEKEKWLDIIKSGVSKMGINPGKLDGILKTKKNEAAKKTEKSENASEKSLASALQNLGSNISKSVQNLDQSKPVFSEETHSKEELKAVNKKLEEQGSDHRYVPAKNGKGTYKVTKEEYEDAKMAKDIKKKVNASVKETKQIQKEAEAGRKEKEEKKTQEKKKEAATKDQTVKEERAASGKKQYGKIRNKNGSIVNIDTVLARNTRLAQEKKKERWILDADGNPVKTMSAEAYKNFGTRLKSGAYKPFQASADLSEEELVGDSYLEGAGNWWD